MINNYFYNSLRAGILNYHFILYRYHDMNTFHDHNVGLHSIRRHIRPHSHNGRRLVRFFYR